MPQQVCPLFLHLFNQKYRQPAIQPLTDVFVVSEYTFISHCRTTAKAPYSRGHRTSRPLRTRTESGYFQEVYLARLRWRKREPLFNAQTLGDVFHHPSVCVGDGLRVRDLTAVKGLVTRTVTDKGCGFGIAVDSTLDLG